MGTGTSHGIPVIACDCDVCRSDDPRDKRLRASALVSQRESDGSRTCVVIDTGPEFRIQCLRHGVQKIDAVFLTHGHADHLDGLDDVRVFSHTRSSGASCKNPRGLETPGDGLAVYANASTLRDVRSRFDYIFKETQMAGGKPKLRLEDCARFSPSSPIRVRSLEAVPIPMKHGVVDTTGWLFRAPGPDGAVRSFAYLTDCNFIPDESIALLAGNPGGIDQVVIDGLRESRHSTHFTFDQAIECAARIGARRAWLTHICHNARHSQISEYCAARSKDGFAAAPAYDGLELLVGEGAE